MQREINWFSPLPPAHTAIAAYSASVLAELTRMMRVTAWTDIPYFDSAMAARIPVRLHSTRVPPDWEPLNRVDVNIYHCGNNWLYHHNIWRILHCCPGVVVLHDPQLQQYLTNMTAASPLDQKEYVRELEIEYGPIGGYAGRAHMRGILQPEFMGKRFPLSAWPIKDCLGVVVHSKAAFDQMCSFNRCPVVCLPLPWWGARWKEHRLPVPGRCRLIVFGFLDSNRRVESVLRAIATHPRKEAFTLDLYGTLWKGNKVAELAASLGISGQVTIHGFVPNEALDAALDAADLAINLRYPTAGETSSSQLCIWSHALPSIVTHIGWFAELPKDATAHISHQREIEELQGRFSEFLDHPETYRRMGERGFQIAERNHSPAAYAQGLVDFVEDAIKFRARAAVFKMSRNAVLRAGPVLTGTLARERALSLFSEESASLAGCGEFPIVF